MRPAPLVVALAGAVVIQTSLMPLLKFGSVQPDLLLVLVALTALEAGPVQGGRAGLVVGAVQDLLWGRYLGLFAGSRALAGYVGGYLQVRFYHDDLVLPPLTCLTCTWIAESVAWVILWISGVRLSPIEVYPGLVWPASLLNGLVGLLLWRPWRSFLRWARVSERG